MDARAMFRCLIPALWLRPESALWYAHMLTLAKEYLGQFESPSLEFGCMDGVNSFILLDGKFDDSFDVYNEVQWDKDSHKRSTLSNDYFDTYYSEASSVDVIFALLALGFFIISVSVGTTTSFVKISANPDVSLFLKNLRRP